MENNNVKTYLDHEVELAYENIRHCQDKMRLNLDCMQDLLNLIQCIPKDVLKEDYEKIENIFINLNKDRTRIYKYTNIVPPKGRDFISQRNIDETRQKLYIPIRDLAYKEIIQIVINRIHISRSTTTGSFNLGN